MAVIAVYFLLRKRYDSNLPLLFYAVAVTFSNISDREINPYLLYVGLISALVLRFEFMGKGFSKFIAFLATSSMCLIIWIFLAAVFDENLAPF